MNSGRPPKAINNIENDFLRTYFERMGYKSVAEASKELEIPYNTLSRWCKNKNLDMFVYMMKLTYVFDEDPKTLIEGMANGAQA